MSDTNHFEIERKFLIRMPDIEFLEQVGERSEIVQTYLQSDGSGSSRVRKRGKNGDYIYTHTVKKRLSDMRRLEQERQIDPEEYERLLKFANPDMSVIYKSRFCVEYMGQVLEIDIFPFYCDRAILEIELEDENQPIIFPPWLEVIRELTEDRRYTNAAMARSVPYEEI